MGPSFHFSPQGSLVVFSYDSQVVGAVCCVTVSVICGWLVSNPMYVSLN